MLIEQRFIWIDKIFESQVKADIISFGSESCVMPLFYANEHWNKVRQLINRRGRVKVITPRVAQNELAGVVSLIEKLSMLQQKVDIVVNDWGILQLCATHKECLHIHLGRQLCRTLLDCPWHKEILENENSEVREIMRSHPYSNTEGLKRLQDKGVRGLELNAVFPNYDLQPIIDRNLEIAVHCESYLLTCGRTCLTKRIMEKHSCQNVCGLEFQLEPSGKWLNYFECNEPFDDYEKSMLDGMAFSGKKVTLPQRLSIDEMRMQGAEVLINTEIEN